MKARWTKRGILPCHSKREPAFPRRKHATGWGGKKKTYGAAPCYERLILLVINLAPSNFFIGISPVRFNIVDLMIIVVLFSREREREKDILSIKLSNNYL